MGKKTSKLLVTTDQLKELKSKFPPNTYSVITQLELKKMDIAPPDYTDKCNGAVVITSGSKHETWLSVITYRVDRSSSMIDKDVISAYYSSSYVSENLTHKHHGNWFDRNTPIPADFDLQICNSLANLYPHKDMPCQVSGSWSEIESKNQALYDAFKNCAQITQTQISQGLIKLIPLDDSDNSD